MRWRVPLHLFRHVPQCYMCVFVKTEKSIKPTCYFFFLFTVAPHICPPEADIWRQLRGMNTSPYLHWPEHLGQFHDTRRKAENPEFTRTAAWVRPHTGLACHGDVQEHTHIHDGFPLSFFSHLSTKSMSSSFEVQTHTVNDTSQTLDWQKPCNYAGCWGPDSPAAVIAVKRQHWL